MSDKIGPHWVDVLTDFTASGKRVKIGRANLDLYGVVRIQLDALPVDGRLVIVDNLDPFTLDPEEVKAYPRLKVGDVVRAVEKPDEIGVITFVMDTTGVVANPYSGYWRTGEHFMGLEREKLSLVVRPSNLLELQ